MSRITVAMLQEVANQAAAAARQEEEFWGLLETQDPPLNRHSSWLGLRRQVCSMLLNMSI